MEFQIITSLKACSGRDNVSRKTTLVFIYTSHRNTFPRVWHESHLIYFSIIVTFSFSNISIEMCDSFHLLQQT